MVLANETVNSTNIIETKVKYECESGRVYTEEVATVECDLETGFIDGKVGKCLRGKMIFTMLFALFFKHKLYKTCFVDSKNRIY